ncbi:MAG: lipoprotein-releasing system transmembrane subunit LolC [Rhodospirillaceae bacterium]|nr:MAG: lipoprotein-releasing system transmembrane subunit LolC [Rhodospirillaceae bacterium]
MFSPFERMVAGRYLRARRKEGFISIIAGFSLLGIALGVATLIVVMSVMGGFREELLTRILGLNGHLSVYGMGTPLDDFDALKDKLLTVEGVEMAAPLIEGQVMVTANGVARGAMVHGLRRNDLLARKIVAENIQEGSFDSYGDGDTIVLGKRLADRMGLNVGDSLTLISPQGNTTVFGTVPRTRSYILGATFEVGMFEYDSAFIFMPLEAAQLFFRLKNKVSGIEVMLTDPDQVDAIGRRIVEAAGEGKRIYNWQQANASFFNAIQVERNVMFLILTLIVVVAAFNIISSLIMLVKDKGQDIAILRTMGATRGMIMRIFFLCGAGVGVTGTLLGFALGLAFTLNIETIRVWLEGLTGTDLFAAEIYFLAHLPVKIDWMEVMAILLMGLGLSVLATLYPSWRAARLDPIEALRYE